MSRTASFCRANRTRRIASWAAKPWRVSTGFRILHSFNLVPHRTTPTNAQSWDYDAVGNWDSVTTNSTTQTRGANRQNEITSVSGATTPTYDNNGNLTKDENDNRFVWDAWNREVKIKNSSNTVIATNAYDALNHKVQVTTSAGLIDKIFGKNEWQVFEEKNGSNTLNRYVWSPVYVDGLVTRDRDTDANGTLDERLFALQDANWNVTGITNTSGTIQERYTETPYGAVTFRDGSGSTISVSTKGWDILHQGAKADIIGDYDFRNRVYSPTLGRPLQSDQLQFEAGEVNFYRWEGNDPNGHLDPSGNRWTFGDVALGAGTAFLIAGGAVLVVGTGGLATPLVVGGAAAVIGGGLAGHYAESSGYALNIGGATGLGVGSIGAGGVLVARFGVEQAGSIIAGTVASTLTGTNVDFTKPGIPFSGLPVVAPSTPVQRRTLYHYTDKAGLGGITESNSLRASIKASNPSDVRYGNGQYVSDFAPGTKTPAQLSREFLRLPWQGKKFTHYVEIDVTDLQVIQGRNGVFVIPNDVPLDLTGRIIGSGKVPPVKPGG